VIAFFATHLVPVRVPISSQPKQFKVQWTPTLVTLDETGEEHHRTVGFLSPEELVPSLMLGIGKSYFDREMFAESEKMLKQLLAEYPRSDAAPEATYYLGVGR
jgi:thioredoxin-related protein